MDTGIRDLVVLVTGASGGIGRATAEAFADEGARLVLHAGSSLGALERWASEQPWRERAMCRAADVRDPQAMDDLVREARLTGNVLTLALREPASSLGGASEIILTYDDTAENKASIEAGALRVLGDTLSGGNA